MSAPRTARQMREQYGLPDPDAPGVSKAARAEWLAGAPDRYRAAVAAGARIRASGGAEARLQRARREFGRWIADVFFRAGVMPGGTPTERALDSSARGKLR